MLWLNPAAARSYTSSHLASQEEDEIGRLVVTQDHLLRLCTGP